LCAKSLTKFLPQLSQTIQRIENDAPKCLAPKKDKSQKPYTLDQGKSELPFVSCNYTGKVSDLITLAHEFAHAVQILASRESQTEENAFMPPLARECCAFWGEIALIDYVQQKDEKLYVLLKKAWSNDNLKYLKADAEVLKQALENNDSGYSYNWNYPVARLYALMLRKQMNHKKAEVQKTITTFFASGSKITQTISMKSLIAFFPIPNPLPKMPKPNKAGFTKYQILGAVTALTISDQQIDVERFTVGSFNHHIAKHIENKTLFIYFKNEQPAAYACWEKKTKEKISLSELCTPFVEPEELQQFMQKYYHCAIEMPELIGKNSPLKEVA